MIIYKITNLINDKAYIGQTINSLATRFKGHCTKRADNAGSYIMRAIQKHGKDNFVVEEIAAASSRAELDILEIYYIKTIGTLAPSGYNLEAGGTTNKQYSLQSLDNISKAQKNRFKTQIHPRLGACGAKNPRSKPVLCLTNGKIYESGRMAALELGVPRAHVNEIARGRNGRKSTKGYRFEYLKSA